MVCLAKEEVGEFLKNIKYLSKLTEFRNSMYNMYVCCVKLRNYSIKYCVEDTPVNSNQIANKIDLRKPNRHLSKTV